MGSLIREVMGMNGILPYFNAGRKYQLSRFTLVRAGYPAEIQNDQRLKRFNSSIGMPIVIEKNREKFGAVPALEYFVPAIVIAGAARRAKLIAEGNTRAWGWVEEGALPINTEDAITSQELLEKTQALLINKFGHATAPWIIALYPFENCLIYQLNGQKFRLGFNLHPASREVLLAGYPTKVNGKYLSDAKRRDLLRRTCLRWSNPVTAVSMYLGDVKAGLFKPHACSSYLPNSTKAIYALLDKKLIGYMDFVRWSLQEQADLSYKTINGQRYAQGKFIIPVESDKSTWIKKR